MKILLINFLLFLFVVAGSAAENSPITFKNQEYVIVDELVDSELYPENSSILVEESLGRVRKYPAISTSYANALSFTGKDKLSNRNIWMLGGLYLLPRNTKEVSYSFILSDRYSDFAATPVRKAEDRELKENSLSMEEMESEVGLVKAKLLSQVEEIDAAELKLKKLSDKAKKSEDIGKVVSYKMELEKIKSFSGNSKTEIERLTKLLNTGRKWEDPKGLSAKRKVLQDQLRDAAEFTTINLRLNKRKRKAAVNAVKQKINLVKTNKNVDTKELSRNLWKLKRKRKELESRLGLGEEPVVQAE